MLLRFSELSLYVNNKAMILRHAKLNISKIDDRRLYKEYIHHFLSHSDQGSYGLGYIGSRVPEFIIFDEFLVSFSKKVKNELFVEESKNLLNLLEINPNEFYKSFMYNQWHIGKYHDVAILHLIDPEEIVNVFLASNSKIKGDIAHIFKERYKHKTYYDKYILEYVWLLKVKKLLKNEIALYDYKLTRLYIIEAIENLDKSINLLEIFKSKAKI